MDKWKCLFIFSLSVLSSEEKTLNNCARDLDCEKGYYCLHSYCTSCLPCNEVMNQHPVLSPSGELVCAQEGDCVNCLSGYQAEDLVNGRRSSECYPLAEKLSLNQHHDMNAPSRTMFYAAFPVLGILLTTAVILYHHAYKSAARFKRSLRSSINGIENPTEIQLERPDIRQPSASSHEPVDQQELLLGNLAVSQLEEYISSIGAEPKRNFPQPGNIPETIDELEQLAPLLADQNQNLVSSNNFPGTSVHTGHH